VGYDSLPAAQREIPMCTWTSRGTAAAAVAVCPLPEGCVRSSLLPLPPMGCCCGQWASPSLRADAVAVGCYPPPQWGAAAMVGCPPP